MSNHVITIEEVDEQLEQLEKKHGHKLAATGEGIAPVDILTKICAIITVAVPILKFVKALLFWKPSWKPFIQQIIDVAGAACGTEPE